MIASIRSSPLDSKLRRIHRRGSRQHGVFINGELSVLLIIQQNLLKTSTCLEKRSCSLLILDIDNDASEVSIVLEKVTNRISTFLKVGILWVMLLICHSTNMKFEQREHNIAVPIDRVDRAKPNNSGMVANLFVNLEAELSWKIAEFVELDFVVCAGIGNGAWDLWVDDTGVRVCRWS